MSGPGHVELIHSNQIDRDGRLLDSCWCWSMALGEVGLNNLDSIPKMKSVYTGLDFDNAKNYDPDAVGIGVVYLVPDMPMGDPCSGLRNHPAKTGMCCDERHEVAACYNDHDHDPATVDMQLDQYKGKGRAEAPSSVQEAVHIRRYQVDLRVPADYRQGGDCPSACPANLAPDVQFAVRYLPAMLYELYPKPCSLGRNLLLTAQQPSS